MSTFFKKTLSRSYRFPVWISLFLALGSITLPPSVSLIMALALIIGSTLVVHNKFAGMIVLSIGWLSLAIYSGYSLAYVYINQADLFNSTDFYPEFLIFPIVEFIVSIGMLVYLSVIIKKETKPLISQSKTTT